MGAEPPAFVNNSRASSSDVPLPLPSAHSRRLLRELPCFYGLLRFTLPWLAESVD
jgi:hypothetical protein